MIFPIVEEIRNYCNNPWKKIISNPVIAADDDVIVDQSDELSNDILLNKTKFNRQFYGFFFVLLSQRKYATSL